MPVTHLRTVVYPTILDFSSKRFTLTLWIAIGTRLFVLGLGHQVESSCPCHGQ